MCVMLSSANPKLKVAILSVSHSEHLLNILFVLNVFSCLFELLSDTKST